MKKYLTVVSFLLISVLSSIAVIAQADVDPEVILSSTEIRMFNDDEQSLDVTIKNTETKSDTFTISVFPPEFNGLIVTPELNHVTLGPGETRTIKLTFRSPVEVKICEPQVEACPVAYTITILSTSDDSITTTKNFQLILLRKSPVFVLSLLTNKLAYNPEETVNITAVISNIGGLSFEDYTVRTTLKFQGEKIKEFENLITQLSEKARQPISNMYTFEKFAKPGVYSIEVALRESSGKVISTRSINFRLNEISDRITQEEKSSFGILSSTTTIRAVNEGNVPTEVRVSATVPKFAKDLFAPEIRPDFQESIGNSLRYTWVFEDVNPGEEVVVVYQFLLWRLWLIIIAIIAVVYFAFKYVFTVLVKKSVRFVGQITKDSEIPVTVELVNRTLYDAKDVVVRDFIPPITKIVPRYETVKPVVKEGATGIEVVRRFDTLRAGEERVLTYRIKPKVDVLGTLRLPGANISYTDRKKRKKEAFSGQVVVSSS